MDLRMSLDQGEFMVCLMSCWKWEGVYMNEFEKIIMILLNLGMLNLLEQSRT